MNQLGFKNFRKFADFPMLSLGDITLLVGGNNAGKSTFVKAALLVYNFINTKVGDLSKGGIFGSLKPEMKFDVTTPFDVNIGTFAKAKKRNTNTKDSVVFSFNLKGFKIEVYVSSLLVNDEIDPDSTTGIISFVSIEDIERNITYSVDYSLGRMYVEFGATESKEEIDYFAASVEERKRLEALLKDEKEFAKIVEIKNEISRLNKLVHNWEGENNIKSEKLDLPLCDFSDSPSAYYLVNLIRSFVEYANVATPTTLKKNSKEYKKDAQDKAILKSKLRTMESSMTGLELNIVVTRIEYIYAHAARQNVFLNSKDQNDYMAQTIHDFMSSKANYNEDVKEFIIKWMDEFKIGNGFRVKVIGGEAYQVFVKNNEDESPLADMGMGSIQLMILLFRLGTYINKYKAGTYPLTVLIEEPEQNLHPMLQSKLANLFHELNKVYHYRFIIETHSEYLIRKTQVLVAKEGYEDAASLNEKNPFMVYYFDGDNEKEPYYLMEYRMDGNFSNEFGPGFFDAATKLLYEIL